MANVLPLQAETCHELPSIRHLTVLSPLEVHEINEFINYLQISGNRFLVLIESYNEAGLRLLARFQPEDTSYCQQKLLCSLDKLHIEKSGLPNGITIRNFIPGKDEDRYADFYDQILGLLSGKPVQRSFVDDIVARASFDLEGYFVAEKDGCIVGFSAVEKEPWGENGSRFGYIYQIGVAKKWRSSGLSGLLLKKVGDFAANKGLTRIGVGVRKSNAPAIRFFTKHGFIPAYEVNGYLVDPDKIR